VKGLIWGLYAAFFVLMGVTYYVARTVNDGLVEHHYYEKSLEFFSKKQTQGTMRSETSFPDCEIDRGLCSKKTGRTEVNFAITPKPVRAMEELEFHLVVSPDPRLTTGLTINLGMPGMHMGKNQILLGRNPDGTYTGKGVIPRCPSGRKLWKATVQLPKEGEVSFTFNVTY